MRFLKPLLGKRLSKLLAVRKQQKTHFHSHVKPTRSNDTLKNYLKSKPTKTLLLFRELIRKSIGSVDSYSFLYVIKACTQKALAAEGKQAHSFIIRLGYEPIIFLQTSLIHFYSATAELDDAHYMFEEIPAKNVVCWTALISAYVDNQRPNKALRMFRLMQMANVEPDQVTLTVALSACADLGALEMGEWIYAFVRRKLQFNADLCLHNALINMYTKCGQIESARELFNRMKAKDVTTWTSMIGGHAIHGQAEEALSLFEAMEAVNKKVVRRKLGTKFRPIVPNDVTFVAVLMACSHAGLVEEGKRYFRSMIEDYGLKPRVSHFGCMVDLLCRAGLVGEAYQFILAMPIEPNAVIWRTLLGACSIHRNIDLAAEARQRLLELDDSLAGDDVAMSNVYAAKGMWDEKVMVRDEIKKRRAPGCSSIEIGSGIHQFVSADDGHPSDGGDLYGSWAFE